MNVIFCMFLCLFNDCMIVGVMGGIVYCFGWNLMLLWIVFVVVFLVLVVFFGILVYFIFWLLIFNEVD